MENFYIESHEKSELSASHTLHSIIKNNAYFKSRL